MKLYHIILFICFCTHILIYTYCQDVKYPDPNNAFTVLINEFDFDTLKTVTYDIARQLTRHLCISQQATRNIRLQIKIFGCFCHPDPETLQLITKTIYRLQNIKQYQQTFNALSNFISYLQEQPLSQETCIDIYNMKSIQHLGFEQINRLY